MKLLVALALFAVACADEVQVVNLPRAAIPIIQMPDIRPLMVPQEVIEAVKVMQPVLRDVEIPEHLIVRFADAPLEAPVEAEAIAYEAVDGVKVHFVDFAPVAEEIVAPVFGEIAPEEFDEGLELHFVHMPLEYVAEQSAGPTVEDIAAPDAVRFVDAPIAEEIAAPDAVRFVDAPIAEEIDAPIAKEIAAPIAEEIAAPAAEDIAAPDAVRFVDAPIAEEIAVPEPVRIAEAPLPAFETVELVAPKSDVEAVKIAIPRLPGKQYADPRLR